MRDTLQYYKEVQQPTGTHSPTTSSAFLYERGMSCAASGPLMPLLSMDSDDSSASRALNSVCSGNETSVAQRSKVMCQTGSCGMHVHLLKAAVTVHVQRPEHNCKRKQLTTC